MESGLASPNAIGKACILSAKLLIMSPHRPTTSVPKGPTRLADVDPQRLALLNQGRCASLTLTEATAVDFNALWASLPLPAGAPQTPFSQGSPLTQRMALAGQLLWGLGDEALLAQLAQHPHSDTVRGWVAYALAAAPNGPFTERLQAMAPLAADAHFGVREWAWLALRPHVLQQLPEALAALAPWVHEANPYLRRFAVEVIRPRGVWCAHCPSLKKAPQQALALLSPLATETDRYVQHSVANWLNDASKTQAHWVQTLCQQWQAAHPNNPHTAYIAKRALRSLTNAAKP